MMLDLMKVVPKDDGWHTFTAWMDHGKVSFASVDGRELTEEERDSMIVTTEEDE